MDANVAEIHDMQVRMFRKAQVAWGLTGKECAAIFQKYDIFGFIEQCYDSLHTTGENVILGDIEELLRNHGVKLCRV